MGITSNRFTSMTAHGFWASPMASLYQVKLAGKSARYVRLQVPGNNCLHLDEVEIFPTGASENVARGRPATQSSVCEWSTRKGVARVSRSSVDRIVQQGLRLAASLERLAEWNTDSSSAQVSRTSYSRGGQDFAASRDIRGSTCCRSVPESVGRFISPRLLGRASVGVGEPATRFRRSGHCPWCTGKWSHMSDQYLGWWSQPGGGLYVLHDFKTDHASLQSLTESFPPGNILRPDISYDGQKILFAWCRYYPGLSEWPDKLDKSRLPEDSFYHLFEVNVDGSGLRQLTFGKYNDFDGRVPAHGRNRVLFDTTRPGDPVQR